MSNYIKGIFNGFISMPREENSQKIIDPKEAFNGFVSNKPIIYNNNNMDSYKEGVNEFKFNSYPEMIKTTWYYANSAYNLASENIEMYNEVLDDSAKGFYNTVTSFPNEAANAFSETASSAWNWASENVSSAWNGVSEKSTNAKKYLDIVVLPIANKEFDRLIKDVKFIAASESTNFSNHVKSLYNQTETAISNGASSALNWASEKSDTEMAFPLFLTASYFYGLKMISEYAFFSASEGVSSAWNGASNWFSENALPVVKGEIQMYDGVLRDSAKGFYSTVMSFPSEAANAFSETFISVCTPEYNFNNTSDCLYGFQGSESNFASDEIGGDLAAWLSDF